MTRRRVTAVVAATFALVVASQAGGAPNQRYSLRQVELLAEEFFGLGVVAFVHRGEGFGLQLDGAGGWVGLGESDNVN